MIADDRRARLIDAMAGAGLDTLLVYGNAWQCDYLRYATGSAPLAGMTRFAPFMPPRRSSLPLVEKLPPSPTRDFVLSQKGRLDGSFAVDSAWWHEHGAALEARFRAWMAA